MDLQISTALAQAIIDYLKHRPYVEVFELVNGILKAPKVPSTEDTEDPPDEEAR